MASGSSGGLRDAARAGDVQRVVALLNEAEIPLNDPDEHGHTALGLAVIFGHSQVVSLLLGAGADANAVDKHGIGILMDAAACPRPDIVRGLIAAGANVNAVSEDGRTALLNAIWSAESDAEVVKALIEAGADPSVADELYNRSPREWAEMVGKVEVAELLKSAER